MKVKEFVNIWTQSMIKVFLYIDDPKNYVGETPIKSVLLTDDEYFAEWFVEYADIEDGNSFKLYIIKGTELSTEVTENHD